MFIWKNVVVDRQFSINRSGRLRPIHPASTDMALLTEGGQPSPIFYKHGPPGGGRHAEMSLL